MNLENAHRRRRRTLGSLVLVCLAAVGAQLAAAADSGVILVAEMERPQGIVAARAAERRVLAGNRDGQQGLIAFRERIRKEWSSLRDLDVVEMSRYHVAAMRGWRRPEFPGELPGRIIGRDPDGTALYLELRGPRLPANFDIVHRHLTFYARYEPATGTLDRVSVTIRLEVFE